MSECKTEKRNGQREHRRPMEQTRGVFLHERLGCGSLSITIPVPLLANKLDVRSVLHRQVSLAAVFQVCGIHEAMNSCKKSKDSLKACFENVNITLM